MSFDFRGNDYIVQDERKNEKVETWVNAKIKSLLAYELTVQTVWYRIRESMKYP